MRKVWLSVDFDFFAREEDEWDWGHAETWTFQELAWFTRVRWYEDTLLEKFANPHPRAFWQKLRELGFNFDTCKTIRVSDSHLFAAHDFLDVTPGLVEVVNFDAHHDMGYEAWKTLKKDWIDKGRVDCANWLLVLLAQLEFLRAACVYPEWKGLREIGSGRTQSWERPGFRDRFRYGVYSEEFVRSLAGDVVGIFVARSGAWMPPWHDQAFADFVNAGAKFVGVPAETPYIEKEKCNPMTPRSFDLEGALAHDRQVKEMQKRMWDEREAKRAAGGK